MVKMIVFSFLICSVLSALGQGDSVTNDILTTKKFRPGIFQKYSQFRSNSPSITKGYTIKADTGKIDRYLLFLENGSKIRNVYGFCDGKDLFVNARVYGRSNYFVKILVLGPLSYFEDQRGKIIGMFTRPGVAAGLIMFGVTGFLVAGSVGSGTPVNPGWIIYLPDNDGEAWALDKKNLLAIFKGSSPELFKKFKAEPRKNDYKTLIQYVQQFNEQAFAKTMSKK